MTITYQRDVKELADQGLTDEQIAQHLSARTAQAISCSDASTLLLETQAIVIDPVTGQRTGPIIDYYLTLDGESKHLVGWFISHVLGSGESVATDEYPRSMQFDGVLSLLPVELQSIGEALLQLGNGKPHAGTTISDVAQARVDYDAGVAQKEADEAAGTATALRQARFSDKAAQFIGPLVSSNDSNDDNWINAIQNIASTWSE
jgi:hypothetical protein